ncbi:hypothetical protein [Jiangella asiatica]|uniref:Uncharacterized protein n=1 Tax=Jiangella asiatica TaxID=2530372 RepID=A0A4R5CWB4_9ACTN|nr:hypothetical protein [Jiangella asiatica]TDE02824.1 hypothetical protein E1269_21270 [Jiangella asiatica]
MNGEDIPTSDHDRLVEIHTMLREHLAPKVLDHESRIRRLERAIWIAAGVAAAVGSAVGNAFAGGIP